MTHRIVLLPGDGIGPEVTHAARACLETVAALEGLSLSFQAYVFGGAAIDAVSIPLPEETLAACRAADAVFLGAVGGPKWDEATERPEKGLLGLRKALGLYANLRPVTLMPGMEALSPLKDDRVAGADLLIVRELTGGMYFGEKRLEERESFDGCTYSEEEVVRIARTAFEAARLRRKKLTSVDKANVLATSKLWRRVVTEVGQDYPDVALDHLYVDATAMHLITNPTRFDVIVTENLFGDILSDEASVIAGSIGLLGSASLGETSPGLFEPIHGSAPDIAGQDRANPAGAIASSAMLLRYGLGQGAAADRLEGALKKALLSGERTPDLGGMAGCVQFTEQVCRML